MFTKQNSSKEKDEQQRIEFVSQLKGQNKELKEKYQSIHQKLVAMVEKSIEQLDQVNDPQTFKSTAEKIRDTSIYSFRFEQALLKAKKRFNKSEFPELYSWIKHFLKKYNTDHFPEKMIALCKENKLSEVVKLISDSNINNKNPEGFTTLMLAVAENNMDFVKLLLEKKPSINDKNNSQQTALDLAFNAGHLSMALLLLQHQATLYDAIDAIESLKNIMNQQNLPKEKILSEITAVLDLLEKNEKLKFGEQLSLTYAGSNINLLRSKINKLLESDNNHLLSKQSMLNKRKKIHPMTAAKENQTKKAKAQLNSP